MSIGKLRHRIEVLKRSVIVTDGNTKEIWTEINKLWASAEPLSGKEYFAAAAVNSEDTVKFRTRYNKELADTLSVDIRIRFEGKVYDVYSILCPFEQKKELIFMTKLYGSGSDGGD